MEIKVKWGLWAAFRASALTLFQMGKGELKLASGGQSCALPGEEMAADGVGLVGGFSRFRAHTFSKGKGELKLASWGQSCALPGEGMARGMAGGGMGRMGQMGRMGWMRVDGLMGMDGPNGADGADGGEGDVTKVSKETGVSFETFGFGLPFWEAFWGAFFGVFLAPFWGGFNDMCDYQLPKMYSGESLEGRMGVGLFLPESARL